MHFRRERTDRLLRSRDGQRRPRREEAPEASARFLKSEKKNVSTLLCNGA
jgi:hypothetical protein